MKNIIFTVFLMLPLLGITQAHLGATEQEIRNYHPDKTFQSGYTKKGIKYIATDFDYGTFTYYINDSTHVTDLCVQVPKDMVSLNTLVQLYNAKYVIVSKTAWTAYLDGGSIMRISLQYLDDEKVYVFYYSPTN